MFIQTKCKSGKPYKVWGFIRLVRDYKKKSRNLYAQEENWHLQIFTRIGGAVLQQ